LFFPVALLAISIPAFGQEAASSNASGSDTSAPAAAIPAGAGVTDSVGDYFSNWFKRVDETQAEQPHWMTPHRDNNSTA